MKKISRRQWIGFGIWATLYVLFCIWMENLWLLLGLFVLADIFLTRFVPRDASNSWGPIGLLPRVITHFLPWSRATWW